MNLEGGVPGLPGSIVGEFGGQLRRVSVTGSHDERRREASRESTPPDAPYTSRIRAGQGGTQL